MKKEAFKVMYNIEDSWWYKGRALVVKKVLDSFLNNKNGEKILDLGSGFGGMLPYLKNYGEVDAMELDAEAKDFCKTRGYLNTYSTSEEAFSARNFSLVGMFDVLEHIEDDKKILSDIYKNLKPGGAVLITVPAYMFLWGYHDIHHHHFRRYTRSGLRILLEESGFKVAYSSYWNFSLFLPIAVLRIFGVGGGESLGKPSFLDTIFKKIVYLESICIPTLFLPFGTGIVAIAYKDIKNE
jgi:SAM-dependent methyltransferase